MVLKRNKAIKQIQNLEHYIITRSGEFKKSNVMVWGREMWGGGYSSLKKNRYNNQMQCIYTDSILVQKTAAIKKHFWEKLKWTRC